MDTLKRMENFCKKKKNMFLPIREGLTVTLRKMQFLKESIKSNYCYIEHFEYHLSDKMVQKIMEVRSSRRSFRMRPPKLSPSGHRGPSWILVSGCGSRRSSQR